MTEAVAFILGALALLATPGPTNTLLATWGAISGFRKSLGLLAGELLGYLLAITALRTAVGPLILAMPALGTVLSALVCVYLLYLAGTLWRHGDVQVPEARPVTVRGVFLTTLLNPKTLIFAFTLLPSDFSLTWAGVVPARRSVSPARHGRRLLDRHRCLAQTCHPSGRATAWLSRRLRRSGRACGRHQRARRRDRLSNSTQLQGGAPSPPLRCGILAGPRLSGHVSPGPTRTH